MIYDIPHVIVSQSHGPLSWITGQLDNARLAHAHLMLRSASSIVRLGHPPLPYLTVSILRVPRPLLRAEAPTLMGGTTSVK